MQVSLLFLSATAASFLGCMTASTPAAPAVSSTTLHHEPFRSLEGRFSVEFPPGMTPEIGAEKLDPGCTIHRAEAKKGAVYFTVDYIDLKRATPIDDERDLDGTRDGIMRLFNGVIEEETRISIEGFPGRQLRARGDSPFGPIAYLSRNYIVGTRLYAVIVTYPLRTQEPQDRVDSFLRSFRLLPEGHAGLLP
ncbi:hypothetical protein LZC95_48960 [Pendulispora brunnea]|uniref:Lipoprotein n=1 Tax=Pendulispora brunnea TaxID=2905690 RepID=A0ABZ2K6P8_9BACT